MATMKQLLHTRTLEMTDRAALTIARHWDAGEAGCGALIMGLKLEIERIDAGELLQVTAHDTAAFIDLPAWCQMTGHSLVAEQHPTYVLKKRMTTQTQEQSY